MTVFEAKNPQVPLVVSYSIDFQRQKNGVSTYCPRLEFNSVSWVSLVC